jgi:hypothetical protein
MALMGIIGAVALLIALRRIAIGLLAFAWLLVLPLLAIAASIPPTMFDEFSHWLPNARFLVERDRFPDATSPNLWSAVPSYPPALSLVGYLVEQLAAHGYELAGKIFNVLVVAGFGLVLAEQARTRIGVISAIAIGVTGASILNPFFDPRIALTAYPDMPSGVMLALCLAACWRSLDDPGPVWRFRIATTVVLVLLRETNVAFVVGLAGGLVVMGWRARSALTALVGPALVAFALWRLYLWSAAMPPALMPLPVAEWNWRAPLTVISALLTDRLMAHPLLGFAAFAVIGMLVTLVLRCIRSGDASLRNLLLLVAAITIAWLLFLAASYVAVLPPVVALEAHSTWRYITQLGPTFTFALFTLAGAGAPATRGDTTVTGAPDLRVLRRRAIAMIVCLLPGAFTLATWRYWKINCRYPNLTVARLMTSSMPPIDETTVIDVNATAGWDAGVIAYHLHRVFGATRQISSAGASLKEGYLLDLGELVPHRPHDEPYSPTVTLFRWTGAEWQPVVSRSFQPDEYACTFW